MAARVGCRRSSSQAAVVALLAAALLLLLLFDLSEGSTIGVCYGRNADDLPTPDKVAKLVQQHNIKYVRIYDANIDVLKAFANTGVELMIGVTNSDLLLFSQFQTNADTWLKNNILPYYPATKITYITVGAEVTEAPGNVSALVVPAMQNIFSSLKKAGLHKKITVSTTHSLGILSRSFPPSAGAFNSSFASFLKPLLEFLADNQSPFMIDIYPYYAYRDSANNVSLDYALFQSSSEVVDPNTGLLYMNMLDAQIDALYFALTALNFRTIKVMVTETGWPSKGAAKETAATPDNAETYNTNLIRHVINDTGTPAKPGEELDIYIFSLFNENRKPGMDSERNWGLFYPDETSVYNLDFTGTTIVAPNVGTNSTNSSGATTWCIASSTASQLDLQSALDWACGQGNVDCTEIQPSQPCYQPDTLVSHASFAFNSYYQQNGATDIACGFGGSGIKVTKNPSYDNCIYATAATINTTRNNVTAATVATSSPPLISFATCVSQMSVYQGSSMESPVEHQVVVGYCMRIAVFVVSAACEDAIPTVIHPFCREYHNH
ncbi:Glucan endo-1,3-beta-glucosidase 13-like protein [Drosera capensis]